MSFSRSQHGHYRPMVHRAWLLYCDAHGIDTGPRKDRTAYVAAHDKWYREQLLAGLGVDSSTDLNAKEDFESAMRHFERLCGDSFYWQMRALKGNERRIIHEIRRVAAGFDFEEPYLLGIARRALRVRPEGFVDLEAEQLREITEDPLPDLDKLAPEKLLKILDAIKAKGRSRPCTRTGKRAAKPLQQLCSAPPGAPDIPF